MSLQELEKELRKSRSYRFWKAIYAPWFWVDRQWMRWRMRRWRRRLNNQKLWRRPKQERDDNLYIVSDNITLAYGVGDTSEEAWADYKDGVLAMLELSEDAARDNPPDALIARTIRQYIEKWLPDLLQKV